MRRSRMVVLVVAGVLLLVASMATGAPSTFSYQGRLTSSSGTAVPDGPYPATFSLWTDSVGGVQVWSEPQDIQCAKGLFSTELGETSSFFDIFAEYAATNLYLQVVVQISGANQELLPRLRIGSVPYAHGARRVVDDTVSTGGTAIFAGVAIPRFIQITNEATKSSIAIDEPGVHRCALGVDDDVAGSSSSLKMSTELGLQRMGGDILVHGDESIARWYADSDNDGFGDVGTEASAKVSRSVLKSYFQSGDTPTQTQIVDSVDADGAFNNISTDLDGDGAAERRIDGWTSMTSAGLMINTKTTALSSMTVGGDCDDTDASWYVDCDDDGDGIAESSVSSSSRTAGASLAIKTKGTSAQRLQAGGDCDDTDAEIYASSDNDDDGVSEARVTIQARDAFGNPGASLYLDCDSDDDGISERTFVVDAQGPVINRTMTFLDPAVDVHITDSADASGARHAINTKGTGTSGRFVRSSTTPETASLEIGDLDRDGWADLRSYPDSTVFDMGAEVGSTEVCRYTAKAGKTGSAKRTAFHSADTTYTVDEDCDGISARYFLGHSQGGTSGGLSMASRPGQSSFSISEPGVQMALSVGDDGSGVYTGEFHVTVTGSKVASIGSNGVGYLSSALGVGVLSPSHPIEVAGGAYCDGTDWVNVSDANLKENFTPVDGEELLEKIENLPISQWNYKGDSDETTHIGPTAQDFKATFGVGSDGKSISTIDPSGIALAAIKQLKKENTELKQEIEELKKLVKDLAKNQ